MGGSQMGGQTAGYHMFTMFAFCHFEDEYDRRTLWWRRALCAVRGNGLWLCLPLESHRTWPVKLGSHSFQVKHRHLCFWGCVHVGCLSVQSAAPSWTGFSTKDLRFWYLTYEVTVYIPVPMPIFACLICFIVYISLAWCVFGSCVFKKLFTASF